MRTTTLLAAVALVGCTAGTDSGAGSAAPVGEQVADFLLDDLNSTSPRYGDAISPRDYLGEVSGWYFFHST